MRFDGRNTPLYMRGTREPVTRDLRRTEPEPPIGDLSTAMVVVFTYFCTFATRTVPSGYGAAIVLATCIGGATVYGSFLYSAISRAAADDGCLRIKASLDFGLLFYDDHSKYCH